MIHDHQDDFDITLMCDLLQVSRQGYYDWIDRPASPAALQRDAIVARKFRITTTDSNHDHPAFENRLARDFAATAPNQKWAADITYIPTEEGFVYLAGVIDLFSRKIVGWSMKDTLHSDLCVEALEMAIAGRRPSGPLLHHSGPLLHHSDRGCQYAGRQYQNKLMEFTLQCSMSRVGNCWDNAVAESLWASLKNELVFQ